MKTLKLKVQRGFTLVEIAIVLLILALIIGAGFSSLGAYLDNAYQSHTMSNLEATKRAMLDYVKVNKHMPCPDTDTPADGQENRDAVTNYCTSPLGTVPYDDIGVGQGVASDDYGNVFEYGVDAGVDDAAIQSSANAASYFNNQVTGDLPFFTLQTPPTATTSAPDSYTVCKKDTNTCDAVTGDGVEVASIPAVLVAFNENGFGNELDGTPCVSSGDARETENCNGDRVLWKGRFDDGVFDDQLVTISGYEIKQQVSFIDVKVNIESQYAGYDLIVRDDVSNANTTNLGTQEDESFYVDTDDDGNGGNFDATVTMKAGNDKVYVEKNVTGSGRVEMGSGNDEVIVKGIILNSGIVDLDTGEDKAWIGGVEAGGLLDAGENDDEVTIYGEIAGTVVMGDENDTLILDGGTITNTADVDGGNGNDWLEVKTQTKAEFDATQLDYVTGFEWIRFSDNTFDTIPYSSP